MIRASELSGRAVVDIDAAEKLGRIEKVIIDPEARRVVAFLVTRGGTFAGGRAQLLLPAATVHAIGPDAVTVRQSGAVDDTTAFDRFPRVSDVVGRKIVSRTGHLLGVVDDVLISGPDGVIVGYELAEANALGALFGGKRAGTYLRADADLRSGRDLIVAPEDALAQWPEAQEERLAADPVSPDSRTEGNAADHRSGSFRSDDSAGAVATTPGSVP